jgi:Ras-related protein Rab-1A
MQRNYDYIFKIIIVGSSAVGKTSILLRFADDSFEEIYVSTLGVDFRFK